jgi:hypothetical protein
MIEEKASRFAFQVTCGAWDITTDGVKRLAVERLRTHSVFKQWVRRRVNE